MVLPLPMIKLGGLIVRTLTKPLAKTVKSRSKVNPSLNAVCAALGQQQHRLVVRFHFGYRGVSNYVIKDLPADQAVETGADLIGELLIFSVAVGVASFEYSRSVDKAKEKERAEAMKKQELEEEAERRWRELEDKVTRLESQLGLVCRVLEHDLDTRIVMADAESKHEDARIMRELTRDNSGASVTTPVPAAAPSSIWAATSNALASIFGR